MKLFLTIVAAILVSVAIIGLTDYSYNEAVHLYAEHKQAVELDEINKAVEGLKN